MPVEETVEPLLKHPENRRLLEDGHALFCLNPEVGPVLMGYEDLAYAYDWPLSEGRLAPTLDLEVIEVCRRYSKVVIPGAFTPTEILTAWQSGADFVKVFPASLGGPSYLKAMRDPLPQVKLIPVGGVSLENTADFIRAGAVAVAVGGNLVKKRAIAEGNFAELTETARQFVAVIRDAKGA